MYDDNEKFKDIIIKSLAVVGTIAVLFIGGWGMTILANNIPNIFSNLASVFVGVSSRFIPSEKIVLSTNSSTINSGEEIILSFEHISKESDGSYSFFYECRSGLHLEHVSNLNSESEVIFCNNSYNFVNQGNSISFKVKSENLNMVEFPVSINFVRNNSKRVAIRGDLILTVMNNAIAPIVEDDSVEKVTILATNNKETRKKTEETLLFNETIIGISDPNGQVDLKPTILEVGYIDRQTNIFTATSSVLYSERGAVRFEVENIGTKTSNTWTFNVVLPTFPAHIFHSKSQQSLAPGDKIEFTFGFDSIRNDDNPNIIVINVDPTSSVKESDENNNIVKIELPAFRIE